MFKIPSFIAARSDDLDAIDKAIVLIGKLLNGKPYPDEHRDADWIIDYIYNTDALAGSNLTLEQTDALLHGKQVEGDERFKGFALGDLRGWKVVANYLKDDHILDIDLIKDVHRAVYCDPENPDGGGVYRTKDVEVANSDVQLEYPEFIAADMDSLVEQTAQSGVHPIVMAALFHAEYESIHPFSSGNGRSGRLLMNYLLIQAGYPPITILADDYQGYLDALTAYQAEDKPAPITELVIGYVLMAVRGRLQRCRVAVEAARERAREDAENSDEK